MKQLIVTADDFGMSDGVCRGILEAMDRGIVTRTSAMVCRDDDAARVEQWSPHAHGRLGVHLQLTDGTCCAPRDSVRSLVDAHGAFPRKRADLRRPVREEVEREWRAQAARASSLFTPTHFDTHHHVHMSLLLLPVIASVAREAHAPARSGTAAHARALREREVACADVCAIDFYGAFLTEERFVSVVEAAFAAIGGSGVVEVMTHPGYADSELAARSSYVAERERELAILTSPSLRARLEDLGWSAGVPAG